LIETRYLFRVDQREFGILRRYERRIKQFSVSDLLPQRGQGKKMKGRGIKGVGKEIRRDGGIKRGAGRTKNF
jgi:hypothetical protein